MHTAFVSTEMPEVNWPTVGVCWALTTTTIVVLFVVVQIVTRHLRKRRKLSRSVKGIHPSACYIFFL